MRTIVGRLPDLGLVELLRLLAAISVTGELVIRNSCGEATLQVAAGAVEGPINPVTVVAYHRKDGSFSFRPTTMEPGPHWQPMEEFLSKLARETPPQEPAGEDFISALRESLTDVSPKVLARVLVATADPRPYRGLEVEWARKGWEVNLVNGPDWPEGPTFDVAVFHVPGSATLAGQGDAWLSLLAKANQQRPPVPVVWVGGLADAYLRHQAMQLGVAFLMPAPAGEVGEAARWFREDLSLCLDRLLQQRALASQSPGEAFQELFLALQSETTAEEARASLLRLAATAFQRGVLLACKAENFEVLGGFGCPGLVHKLPRGIGILEGVVIRGRPALYVREEEPALASLFSPEQEVFAYPVKVQGQTVGLLLTSGVKAEANPQELVAVAAGAGPLLGLRP
ncbi:MAG: hypothetical protein ACUVRQ_10200 [Thermoanaerobaculaceae bacterium]